MVGSYRTLYLADEQATERFGRVLAAATRSGNEDSSGLVSDASIQGAGGGIIYLHGDLGAGKTTLTRGLMRGYGYQGAVKSPTYTLVEPYEFDDYYVYHFDLYRLADPEEVEFLGVEDYFEAGKLCIIEWAERGQGFLPPPDLELTLQIEGDGRRLCWQARTALGNELEKRIIQAGDAATCFDE